jgi:hypothetical protein
MINSLCNTLKLVIFSLYVIYVLGLINISKYEAFFQNKKLAEIFWLHFYREAMLPPHLCALLPCSLDKKESKDERKGLRKNSENEIKIGGERLTEIKTEK